MNQDFEYFISAFEKSCQSKTSGISTVLENVFSMREIGNKTHGDLAEVALTDYINCSVDGFSALHTGKINFRAKNSEEDITVTNEKTQEKILISVKAYGVGPLQLSTDKESEMFPTLKNSLGETGTSNSNKIKKILETKCFASFGGVNVLPLIYDEKQMSYEIMLFNLLKAYESISEIKFSPPRPFGKKTTFPIYKFYGPNDEYAFEVRYGNAKANALQRGMWTHTKNAEFYFRKIFGGNYEVNNILVKLVPKILNVNKNKHAEILKLLT